MARVLVADDEPGIRNLICDILKDEGYDVIPAPDGFRALEHAKEADLAVIDMMMPGLTGEEVVERMNQDSRTELPVLFISAMPNPGHTQGRPRVKFLSKPFDIDTLLEAVSSLLA